MIIDEDADAIQRQCLRRNARIRAYRGAGVPIAGQWTPARGIGGLPLAELELRCEVCGADGTTSCNTLEGHGEAERRLVAELAIALGCRHLFAFLNIEDSAEIQAVAELELLSGA